MRKLYVTTLQTGGTLLGVPVSRYGKSVYGLMTVDDPATQEKIENSQTFALGRIKEVVEGAPVGKQMSLAQLVQDGATVVKQTNVFDEILNPDILQKVAILPAEGKDQLRQAIEFVIKKFSLDESKEKLANQLESNVMGTTSIPEEIDEVDEVIEED